MKTGAVLVLALLGAVGVGAVALAASTGDNIPPAEQLTRGKSVPFAGAVNDHAYKGESWPPVGDWAMFMIWPEGHASEWVSYVHNRKTNKRVLNRSAPGMDKEIRAQIIHDYGITGGDAPLYRA